MKRPPLFWALLAFLALLLLLLVGQVLGLVNYQLAVRLGLQEPLSAIGPYGVVVNKAFCLADTALYVPLVLLSVLGLWQRRRWALLLTAASLGITLYWPLVSLTMLQQLPGTAGYSFDPPGFYTPLLAATAVLALAGLVAVVWGWELLNAQDS